MVFVFHVVKNCLKIFLFSLQLFNGFFDAADFVLYSFCSINVVQGNVVADDFKTVNVFAIVQTLISHCSVFIEKIFWNRDDSNVEVVFLDFKITIFHFVLTACVVVKVDLQGFRGSCLQ